MRKQCRGQVQGNSKKTDLTAIEKAHEEKQEEAAGF